MKFRDYVFDRIYVLILFVCYLLLIYLLFSVSKVPSEIALLVYSISTINLCISFLIDFFRKRNFYTDLLENIEALDKAYLVLETINEPNFYEGKLLYRAIYDIDKSMIEHVHIREKSLKDFKEYLEMWIHEVKMPISSLELIAHNHKELFDKTSLEQLRRIDSYVEQVLYYVRQETASKDYLIKEISLKKIVNNIALKHKDTLLEEKIDFYVTGTDSKVYSDSKWLEFILDQIVSNSIKYKKEGDSYIKISIDDEENYTSLTVLDNGVGISASDSKRVFEKSFTGKNGRIKSKSTGMGLYIVHNLLESLGHKIDIESKEGEFTKVTITIFKNKFYDVVR